MSELPEWKVNDDGTITGSALAHEKALLYIFIETAIEHNNKRIKEIAEINEQLERTTQIYEALKAEREATEKVEIEVVLEPEVETGLTKADINKMLMGSYTTSAGISRWWKRTRVALGGKTPNEMWEIDKNRVIKLVKQSHWPVT